MFQSACLGRDRNTCNATDPTGCNNTLTRPIVGGNPYSISIDFQVGTAHVADDEGVSLMPLAP